MTTSPTTVWQQGGEDFITIEISRQTYHVKTPAEFLQEIGSFLERIKMASSSDKSSSDESSSDESSPDLATRAQQAEEFFHDKYRYDGWYKEFQSDSERAVFSMSAAIAHVMKAFENHRRDSTPAEMKISSSGSPIPVWTHSCMVALGARHYSPSVRVGDEEVPLQEELFYTQLLHDLLEDTTAGLEGVLENFPEKTQERISSNVRILSRVQATYLTDLLGLKRGKDRANQARTVIGIAEGLIAKAEDRYVNNLTLQGQEPYQQLRQLAKSLLLEEAVFRHHFSSENEGVVRFPLALKEALRWASKRNLLSTLSAVRAIEAKQSDEIKQRVQAGVYEAIQQRYFESRVAPRELPEDPFAPQNAQGLVAEWVSTLLKPEEELQAYARERQLPTLDVQRETLTVMQELLSPGENKDYKQVAEQVVQEDYRHGLYYQKLFRERVESSPYLVMTLAIIEKTLARLIIDPTYHPLAPQKAQP